MPQPSSQQTPDAVYRIRLLSWAAMLSAIVMYFVLIRSVHPTKATPNPTLVPALLLLGVALVAASFPVKAYFFKRAHEAGNPKLGQTGELVALAICEMAALFGVLVWFLSGAPQYWWFLILGAAGQLLHWPQRQE